MARQVSPNTLASLISTYVKRGSEEAEARAHKALTILHARDRQVELLQHRVAELEGAAGRLEAEVPHLQLPSSPDETDEPIHDTGSGGYLSSGDSAKDSCDASLYPQADSPSGARKCSARHLVADARTNAPAFRGDHRWMQERNWEDCGETQETTSEYVSRSKTLHCAERSTSSCVLPRGVHTRCQQVIDELKRHNNHLQAAVPTLNLLPESSGNTVSSRKRRMDIRSRKRIRHEKLEESDEENIPELEMVKETSEQSNAEYSAILSRVQLMVSKLKPRRVSTSVYTQSAQTNSSESEHSDVEVQTAETSVSRQMISASTQTKPASVQTVGASVQTDSSSMQMVSALVQTYSSSVQTVSASVQADSTAVQTVSASVQTDGGENGSEKEDLPEKLDYQRLQEENAQLKLRCSELEKQNEDFQQHYKEEKKVQDAQFDELKRHKINKLVALQNTWLHATREINLGVHVLLEKGEPRLPTLPTNSTDSNGPQTENAERDADVPPQWLLEAGLNHPPYSDKSLRTNTKELLAIQNSKSNSKKEQISLGTQVDMPDPREHVYLERLTQKDEELIQQEETIEKLNQQVMKHAEKLRELGEAASLGIMTESIGNRVVDEIIEEKVLRICRTVVNTYGLDPELPACKCSRSLLNLSNMDAHRSDLETTGTCDAFSSPFNDANVDLPQRPAPGSTLRKGERPPEKAKPFENDVNVLRMRLTHMKTNYDKAKAKIKEQQEEMRRRYHFQDDFEKAMQKMTEDVTNKEKELSEAKRENEMLTQRLREAGEPVQKVSKQSENLRTQGVQGRLRAANQNIINLNKTICSMRQELEVSQATIISLKTRIVRSESCNQNRLVLIDNYKGKLQDMEDKLTVVVAQNNSFKDVIESFKTQVYHLKIQVTKVTTQRNEYMDEIHRLKKNMHSEVTRAIADIHCRMAHGVAQKQLEEVRSYYNRQICVADQRIQEAERRVQQFSKAVETFLEMVQRYGMPSLETPSNASIQTESRREAQELACSILNLTPTQLQSLMTESMCNEAGERHKISVLSDHCKKLFSLEFFSEELAEFMFKIVLNHFEPDPAPLS